MLVEKTIRTNTYVGPENDTTNSLIIKDGVQPLSQVNDVKFKNCLKILKVWNQH